MAPFKKIRVAVIGVGRLGQHHARTVTQITGTELTAVVDTDKPRVEQIAYRYRSHPFTDYHQIIDKIDAAIISVPTPLHYPIARTLLANKIHCLIEKPITTNVNETEDLVNLAQKNNLRLQVGHIERFNPGVQELKKYITNPRYIEVRRIGSYNPQIATVGVVLDLMIHDLDILLDLVPSAVSTVEAIGTTILSAQEDMANVRIKFVNNCIADLSASRLSTGKYRYVRIFQPDSYLSLDYADRKLKIYRKKKERVQTWNDIEMIFPEIIKTEPLTLELQHFIDCIRTGSTPLVSGEQARNSLILALSILHQINAQPQ